MNTVGNLHDSFWNPQKLDMPSLCEVNHNNSVQGHQKRQGKDCHEGDSGSSARRVLLVATVSLREFPATPCSNEGAFLRKRLHRRMLKRCGQQVPLINTLQVAIITRRTRP